MQANIDLLTLLRNNQQDVRAIIEKCHNIEYFNSLITCAKKNKLLPSTISILISAESGLRNDNIKKLYQENNEKCKKGVHNQLQTMESIRDIYPQDKVVWIKGMPLSILIYNDPHLRRIGDIDLLVDSSFQKDFANELVNLGYKKLGIVNKDIGLRFTVNYHEIQLKSPSLCLLELKVISGEMNAVNSNNIITDFFAHTMDIEIGGQNYRTLDITYTLLHLFLSAFSNSTTCFNMSDNGLRDVYEIALFTKKYEIDYNKLYEAADLYGICFIILGIMHKTNKIFGLTFEENIISIFNNQINKPHMVAKLYNYFSQYYAIDYIEELFSEDIKSKAYYNAICDAYYNSDITFNDNCLSPEILDYKLIYSHKLLTLDLYINSKYYFDDSESTCIIKFLSSNKKMHDTYGHFFVLAIKLKSGTAKVLLNSESADKNMQVLNIDIQPEVVKVVEGKLHITVDFEPIFLDPNNNKICYNVQLEIQNQNDDKNGFTMTELIPAKSTFPMFYTDYLDNMIEK
ncbi:nucleotidyltransferase family protein [Paenibacillus sp. FSL H7-0350]|uniref:nucleotidyltransferase family protein n=1 Tax=Paenibacillus sp. FSL H7-0350 TaxID=2975345 RepID=UPI0031584BF9